jgi:hypothetical protein
MYRTKQKVIMNIATEAGFQQALSWTQGLLRRMADGGVWVIPRTGAVLRIDSHKELRASMYGMQEEPCVVDCMRALGWKVTPMESPCA